MLRTELPDDPRAEAVFDALGNSVRRAMLRRLAQSPASVSVLASAFTVSRPAISRHLATLQAAGLVHHDPSGTRNVYAIDPHGFVTGTEWLGTFWDEAEARLRLVAENLPEDGSA